MLFYVLRSGNNPLVYIIQSLLTKIIKKLIQASIAYFRIVGYYPEESLDMHQRLPESC